MGEDLPDQSVNSGRDSSEDVVIEYERVLDDSSLKIGCDEEDLFDDDGIIDSQLEHPSITAWGMRYLSFNFLYLYNQYFYTCHVFTSPQSGPWTCVKYFQTLN